MKLEGKVALITGAGSGMGQAMALLFAREGADIVVNDIDLLPAEKTAISVKQLGRQAIPIQADVADEEQVEAMVDRAVDELGGIHILVNNAGYSGGTSVLGTDAATWDRMQAVVLRGTYLCCRSAGKYMVKQREGNILNISSTAGIRGPANMTAYASAKAGVINLTAALAQEWAEHNIRVNCIAPGLINTPMTQKTIAHRFTPEVLKARIALGRMGQPEEIAKAALFLVSDDSSFITGVTLPVDGGALNRH